MKIEKEITIEINCTYKKLIKILNKNGFKLQEEYNVYDKYMIQDKDIKHSNYLDTLKKAIILREISMPNKDSIKRIVYKYKNYNNLFEIIEQGKINCNVNNIMDAKELLNKMNYNELIKVNNHLETYANGEDQINIQYVNNKHIYIEIDYKAKFINKEYRDIDEMKNVISKYKIPIKENNYFVKKAEIELKEKYKNYIFSNINYIGKNVNVKIDRPLGSKHPKYNYIYPINYGYVPNTLGADGEELDCYILGVYSPLEKFDGECKAVIHRINDDDDKLIIMPNNKEYSDEQIEALVEFQEQYFKHILIK